MNHGLSPKQFQIAKLMASGIKDASVAHKCDITVGTLNGYRTEIYAKLHVNSKAELSSLLSNMRLWKLVHLILGDNTPSDVWDAADEAIEALEAQQRAACEVHAALSSNEADVA